MFLQGRARPGFKATAAGCLLLALAVCAAGAHLNPYCNGQYEFFPDGSRQPGNPEGDWSSYGKGTGFQAGPCLSISGIGVTETFAKTVIVIDRSDVTTSVATLPGTNVSAHAEELNLKTWQQRPLDIITNTFCSTAQHGKDGVLYSIGGDWTPAGYYTEGEFSIRAFAPCNDGSCGFEVLDKMAHSRWYPTSILLGDGRLMVVGGSTRGNDINYADISANNIEYFPRAKGETFHQLDFLERALPYNLYPFVHLLPSGKVFIFASNSYTLFDTAKSVEIEGDYPVLDVKAENGQPIYRSYPLSATSALFPIRPGQLAEVMICGGNSKRAKWAHKVDGFPMTPADNHCWRIHPEAETPRWTMEKMKLRRTMANAVLLPDGHLFIVGGAQTGFAGIPTFAHNASLTPELYNTATHLWYPGPLATSKVPRVYHSSAILLHDASVFISGSNPQSQLVQSEKDFPTDFRTEFFWPPYMRKGLTGQVKILAAPETIKIGKPFTVTFTAPWTFPPRAVRVVLAQPGFSTHGSNHGMRNVELQVALVHRLNATAKTYSVTAMAPPSTNHCPPTWYWLFVLVFGVPNNDGIHIFVNP